MTDGAAYRDARSRDCLRSEPADDPADGWFAWDLSLLVDFASESGAGSFRGAGNIEDAGAATYRFIVADVSLEGVLALEGRAGSLRLESVCTATFSSALSAAIEGSVVIVDGDGAYADISGAGRLAGRLAYDASRHGFSLDATCRVLT